MVGLFIIFVFAAVLLTLLIAAILAWDVTHPARRTAAWALAHGYPLDPKDIGLPFEECSLDRPDGVKLPYWKISNARATDPSLAVIILHGWGRSRIDSLSRVGPWRSLASCILVPELRGHGEASASISRLGDEEVSDLVDLIHSVDHERIVLVGHSLGACTAIHAASTTDRIAGVVAYGPYTHARVPMSNRLRVKGLPARPFSDLALGLLRFVAGVVPPRTLDAKSGCPVLIIHGRDDLLSPESGIREIADRLNACVEWVDGADHENAHLVNTEHHDQSLRAFLGSISTLRTPQSVV